MALSGGISSSHVATLLRGASGLPATVAAAQAIQLPVALSAGAVHAWSGALDLLLALQLGSWLLLGSLAGQWAARRIAVAQLQRLVSLLLIATGLWLAWRLFQ